MVCHLEGDKKMSQVFSNKESIVHAKRIHKGKLYDTEKAELIKEYRGRALFRTKKGNYFWADVNRDTCVQEGTNPGYYIAYPTIGYWNIKPVSKKELKKYLGKYDLDEYERIFGWVEEA